MPCLWSTFLHAGARDANRTLHDESWGAAWRISGYFGGILKHLALEPFVSTFPVQRPEYIHKTGAPTNRGSSCCVSPTFVGLAPSCQERCSAHSRWARLTSCGVKKRGRANAISPDGPRSNSPRYSPSPHPVLFTSSEHPVTVTRGFLRNLAVYDVASLAKKGRLPWCSQSSRLDVRLAA